MFNKILIANRGEIACRIIKTCKKLGIKTVAVYSDVDIDCPHVKLADESYLLGPAAAKDSYLNMTKILRAVIDSGADAVHPGYGFLSEKSEFCRELTKIGVTFIGPSPDALDAFGDKMKARSVATKANVEPPPGIDKPINIETPEEIQYAKEVAARVGYPIIVKAVGGGGGIGMQIVQSEDGMEKALKSCSDRGKASFSDHLVYIERYMDKPRHIEVQVFGDKHGNVYSLGERECSLQRRHQKIIEESPSPAWFFQGVEGAKRRKELHEAAIRVVKEVGYYNAGTCEFIANDKGEMFFLEVNARLQVEHPVTEEVTGLDLIEWQLRVASGEKLPKNFGSQWPNGHSIEARLYAEDPMKGFIPKPGPINTLNWPSETLIGSVRIDSGVEPGGSVTPFYDPMIAKIITWGQTRDDALEVMRNALDETEISSVTNKSYLREVCDSPEFMSGQFDTKFAEPFAKQLIEKRKTQINKDTK